MEKLWMRNWKYKLRIAIAGITVLGFAGCGSVNTSKTDSAVAPQEASTAAYEGYASNDVYVQEYTMASEESAPAEAGGTSEEVSVASNRKLIKTVSMDVETEVFDELLPKVESKVSELGGYMENLNVYNGSSRYGQNNRSASLTIRIPGGKLYNFVTAVSDISNVTSRSENTQDITLQYVDTESHKEALEVEQERLLELLEKAESMEDIIAIESRLSEVRYQLQSMESQLRTYDNLVDYSTVYLTISEVEVLTPSLQVSAWERISVGFISSMNSVGNGIKNFFIYLIIWLPYIVVWAIVIILAVLLIKHFFKRKYNKSSRSFLRRYKQKKEDTAEKNEPNKAEKIEEDRNDKEEGKS
ncbi:uncharacterized protein DUF4349 [Kineothrix alysoides]|uniref:Uncharacterized protein DUF4349 n=1 Tax=Kineothrix alysoides TaxID=1469948 RepID=A0A4R1R3K7_9FIRM|nr:DUF4349 domain-containing protein [Kineothrix alysoides]TCL59989.1 uncharacterized protein DUF4349 [Kineothrix alysoides]